MEAEKLLEGYVEKIHNLRPLKDKWGFFKYGVKGEFKTIRDNIIKFKPPKWDDRKAFIEICDNRIDRLKNSTTEIVTSLGAIIAIFAVFFIKSNGTNNNSSTIWVILLLIFIVVLIVAIFYYRTQMYAWYAVKEGVLLMRKNKND